MPPSSSHSPRRKRVRKYLSASALKWNPKTPSGSAATHLRKRRGSSASSSGPFSFSHSMDSRSDLGDLDILDDSSSAISHAETFPIQVNRPPLTYASLPPTPISSPPPGHRDESPPRTSPPSVPTFEHSDGRKINDTRPFSLWDYLREELLATDFDSHQELKWERVSNFLSMPVAIEKVCNPPYCDIVSLTFHRSCFLVSYYASTLSCIRLRSFQYASLWLSEG